MTISRLYIPLFNIEEVILDKDTGLPLSGGVVRFFRDLQRVTPKSVFQISGDPPDYSFVDVGAVFTLGISGTFVDGTGNPFVPYAYPFDAAGAEDRYFVTVVSAGGVPQFTREAVPFIGEGETPGEDRINTENELSNPQFVEVNIPPGITTLSVTGTNTVTPVAPGWDIISTGTDSIVLERLEPTAANVPTNPPFALRIQAGSGLGSSITLRQRLLNTVSFMRSQYISGTITAAVLGGGGSALAMNYAPSSGSATNIIPATNISTDGAYHTIVGNALIPEQSNPAASTGYTDINIVIPTSRNLAITSLQIVGVATSMDIPFDQQTADRQKDHLFHYYEDAAVHQAKDNLLTGWTFGINPWQFRSTANSNVANNTYTADQTILIQQAYVDSATGNNVSVGRGTAAQNYGYNVRAVTAANKFALVQYLDPSTIRPYWGQTLSVMARVQAILGAGHATTPQFKIRLIYRTSLPATTAQAVPVSSWANTDNAIPGLAGWTYITPVNDPTYTITSTEQEFAFNGFVLPASSADDMTLGIIFIMMNNLNSTGTPDQLLFDRISLVNSDFAVDAAPETWDESLRKCQYYYEKSYDDATLPTTNTAVGALVRNMTASQAAGGGYAAAWEFEYNTVKRGIPVNRIYAVNGALAQVLVDAFVGGVLTGSGNVVIATYWNIGGISTKSTSYLPTMPGAGVIIGGGPDPSFSVAILFHYEIDARLGI